MRCVDETESLKVTQRLGLEVVFAKLFQGFPKKFIVLKGKDAAACEAQGFLERCIYFDYPSTTHEEERLFKPGYLYIYN